MPFTPPTTVSAPTATVAELRGVLSAANGRVHELESILACFREIDEQALTATEFAAVDALRVMVRAALPAAIAAAESAEEAYYTALAAEVAA